MAKFVALRPGLASGKTPALLVDGLADVPPGSFNDAGYTVLTLAIGKQLWVELVLKPRIPLAYSWIVVVQTDSIGYDVYCSC